MEEPVQDQSSAPASKGKSSSRLRYPLRSAAKLKPPVPESANPSAPKSGRPVSTVTKSVSVLNLSGKDKSVKPIRRLSTPAKSAVSPLPRPHGINTPKSDVSRSSSRRKFCVLSSASYWLTQIKLSESADKHNISLGLFKLALEAGSEPYQKMRDELKAYARRHNLAELGEPAKRLLESYNIFENLEPQVSETISQVFEEGTRSSDDDVRSSSSVTGVRKLKPKSLDVDPTGAKASPAVAKSGKKNATSKDHSGPKTKKPSNRKSVNTNTVASENVGHSITKKSQKTKKESDINKSKTQKQDKDKEISCGKAEPLQENKENMVKDSPQMDETGLAEA